MPPNDPLRNTDAHADNLSEAVPPRADPGHLDSVPEEGIRSLVVDLVKRRAGPEGNEAASELTKLLESDDFQGQLFRAALIEELILFEEATLRGIVEGDAAHCCFRAADHIANAVTNRCGKEMSQGQRARLLDCTERYLEISCSAADWGPAAARQVEHAVSLINKLFLWAEATILAKEEQVRLGGAFVTFLSKHEVLLRSPELYCKLASPISTMVRALVSLDVQGRGRLLKALFVRVNELCDKFLEGEEIAGVCIGDPIGLIHNLLEDKQSWPSKDSAHASSHDLELAPEEEASWADDSDIGKDNLYSPYEDGPTDDVDAEEQYLDTNEDDQGLEEDVSFLEQDADEMEVESIDWTAAADAKSVVREWKSSLTRALRRCPSLDSDTDFWEGLVFGQSAYEPGAEFASQAYARTGIEALEALLIAIPLSMREEVAIVIHLVTLLEMEDELTQLHGMALPSVYKRALDSLAKSADILHIEEMHGHSVGKAGYRGVIQFVDDTIRSIVTDAMDAEWENIQDLSETGLGQEEMRQLLGNFIERVWGK